MAKQDVGSDGRPKSRGMRVLVSSDREEGRSTGASRAGTPGGRRTPGEEHHSISPDGRMSLPSRRGGGSGRVSPVANARGGKGRQRRASFIGERPPSANPEEGSISLDQTLDSVGWEHAETFDSSVIKARRASMHRDLEFELEKLTHIPASSQAPPPGPGSPMNRSTTSRPSSRAATLNDNANLSYMSSVSEIPELDVGVLSPAGGSIPADRRSAVPYVDKIVPASQTAKLRLESDRTPRSWVNYKPERAAEFTKSFSKSVERSMGGGSTVARNPEQMGKSPWFQPAFKVTLKDDTPPDPSYHDEAPPPMRGVAALSIQSLARVCESTSEAELAARVRSGIAQAQSEVPPSSASNAPGGAVQLRPSGFKGGSITGGVLTRGDSLSQVSWKTGSGVDDDYNKAANKNNNNSSSSNNNNMSVNNSRAQTSMSMKRSSKYESKVSGIFLADKYSACQLGEDGYGAPPGTRAELYHDHVKTKVGDGKGSSTKRRVKTFRPRTAAERTEQELKRMQASSPDAFVNPMSAHMMRSRAKPKAFGGPITKYPLFSREELLQEAAIDAAHDNHPYVQDVTGGLGKPLRKPGGLASVRIDRFSKCYTINPKSVLELEVLAVEEKGLHAPYKNPNTVRVVERGLAEVKANLRDDAKVPEARNLLKKIDAHVNYNQRPVTSKEPPRSKSAMAMMMKGGHRVDEDEDKQVWAPAPNLYPGVLVNSAHRHSYVDRMTPSELRFERKSEFWLPKPKTTAPGSQTPAGTLMPFREVSGRGDSYVAPVGIRTVGRGLGYRAETPGI